MNNRSIVMRSLLVAIILIIFGASIYPLRQRDFYKTFQSLLTKDDPKIQKVIDLAKQKEAANKDLYPSIAIVQAANELDVYLPDYFAKQKGLATNRDVARWTRQSAAGSIKFGLDLAGGTEFLVSVVPDMAAEEDTGEKATEGNLRDRVIEILRNRIDKSGLNEPEIAPQGENRISIKVPVATEAEKEELRKLVQMSARLQFRLVAENSDELAHQYQADPTNFVAPVGLELKREERQDAQGRPQPPAIVFLEARTQMDGTNVTGASVVTDQFGQREILLSFNMTGAQMFGKVTSANVGRRLGIVLDGTLYSAPTIQTAIYGNAQITGAFSVDEANRISTALVCGNLPAKAKIDGVFDTDPTLGKESVKNGQLACIIGTLLVILCMLYVYRLAGLVANVALVANILLLLGALASFGATLTLPGIAGILLSIGMAVDANVLIFERIREEVDNGKTLFTAIDLGFNRAFITILDSNLTTLVVAIALYWWGTGAIRGFAITLSIGLVASMFTAIFMTRLIFDIMGKYGNLRRLTMVNVLKTKTFNFIGVWKPCVIASLSMIAISLLVAAFLGKNALSVDFTGGSQMYLNYAKWVSPEAVTQELRKNGMDPKLSYKSSSESGGMLEIVIPSAKEENGVESPMTRALNILNKAFPDAKFVGALETSIGGLVGWDFAKNAIIATIFSFIGILIYVSLRFEFSFAAAAVLALVHDAIISLGVLLLCGHQISMPVIAAVLTIVGFSVNDTIVIFDRIRENLGLYRSKMSYKDIINKSVNETLRRTILTSFTVFLTAMSLFVFGGEAIRGFATIMLAGVIVGSYSTVFIASPIISLWHKKLIGVKD